MKSIWLCVSPLGACHVVLREVLCGKSVLVRVSLCLLANSRNRSPLSLVSPLPNRPSVPAHWAMRLVRLLRSGLLVR